MKRRQRVRRSGRVGRLRASAEGKARRSVPGATGGGSQVKLLERVKHLLEEAPRGVGKRRITLNLDADVLAWFKGHGRRYQREINRALRRVMREEREQSVE